MTLDANDVLREQGPTAVRHLHDSAKRFQPKGQRAANGKAAYGRQVAHGNRAAQAKEGAPREVQDGVDQLARRKLGRFASFSIDDIEEPCLDVFFLIHGLMVRYGIHLTYGPSSVGKTFAKLHALLHVATGRKYNGRRTEKALVIYVTGEGERMFRNRLYLAKKKLGIEKGEAAFRYITDMPDLAKGKIDADELIKVVKAIAAERQYAGLAIVVVIDTASTALKGAKEDEVGLGTLMSNAKTIADELGGLTAIIHHTGKNIELGPRGSSLLSANSDVVWRIEDLEGNDCASQITVEKNRDGDKNIFWTFERKVERLGENEYGDEITTCHIELTSEPQFQKKKAEGKSGDGDVAFDEAFREVMCAERGHGFEYRVDGDRRVQVRAVALAHVKDEFWRRYATGKDGKERKRTAIANAFSRALKASTRRYRTRAVTIESDADVTRYRLAKNRIPKPKGDELCQVEIIWDIKHEPRDEPIRSHENN